MIYSVGGSLIVQFLSVPILISVWGLSGYGSWLLLSTLPSALLLVDAGLTNVASNRMAAHVGADRRADAVTAFSTVWVAITAASVLIGLVAITTVLALPGRLFPTNAAVTVADARGAAIGLVVYAVAILQMEVGGQIGFRATGRFAEGAAIGGTTQMAERVAVLAGAAATGSLAVAAGALAATRIVGMVVLLRRYRRGSPDLVPDRRRFRATELRSLAPLAGGVILLPVGFAIALQGPLLVLGLTSSQATVGLFGAVRTFTRFALQLMNMATVALMPEFASASGQVDGRAREEIFGLNLIIVGLMATGLAIGFALFGRIGFDLWLPGKAGAAIGPLLLVLAAGTLINGVWSMIGNMILAANRPFLYTPVFVAVVAAVDLALVWPASRGDLVGVGVAILVGEVIMLVHVSRAVKRLGIESYRATIQAAIDRIRHALAGRSLFGRSAG